jgi:Domain of unknown function (DUF4412)
MQKMLRQMGGGAPAGPPPQVTIERTNETEQIAGLPTRRYRVLSNGTPHADLWLTSEAALLRELDAARAPETFGRMSACMVGMAGGERPEASPEFRKLYAEGWPLRIVHLADGARAVATVTTVEQREIPETEFAAPSDYRAAPLTEVFATRAR